jgi:hypothetical protein
MDDILSDKPEKPEKPEPREPEAKEPKEPKEPKDKSAAEPADKPEKLEVERATSRRKEHQKKEWEAQGRDPETGKFLPKEGGESKPDAKPEAKPEAKAEPAKPPEKPAAPVQEMTEKERGLLAEADRQRRRNQQLEQELAAARGQKPEEKKAFWDDPEGALKKHQAEMANLGVTTRLQTAELIARSRYPDFDEKVTKFAELVQQTPGLAQQWLAAPDPAEFAYRTGKNHLEIQQAGSLDKLREEIDKKARTEERAKVEAEFKAKQDEAERQRAALTGTLSDVRGGAVGPQKAVWNGPTPMGDILKH